VEIEQWLRSLGLESYEQAFRDNGVDFEVLPHLTAEDIKEIGVSAVGHRRKILDAIAGLASAKDAARLLQEPFPSGAERRHLTVMFCDLVGSTALSARLDPEDLRELLRVYHESVREVVNQHGGFVAKYLGDGALIYFGYPRANEHDAERAVRTGLALVDAISRLSVLREKLHARVGLATGLVVVGDLIGNGEAQERGIVGKTPNLAARLQGLADVDTVVIADATRRLIGELFELFALSPSMLKGFDEPVTAWRVVGESNRQSRFEALHGSNVAPIVGRDEELDLILSRWRRAQQGGGQVVLVVGEPGIGKSRLALALREGLGTQPSFVQSFACSPHHTNSALFPFASEFEQAAGFIPGDNQEARVAKLKALLEASVESATALALFADLLNIPLEGSRALADISPLQKKSRLFRAFLERLERMAKSGPVLLILEDAHWLDPTSRELFDQIVDRLRNLPALLLVTLRPDVFPPWIGFPHVSLLTLNRLAQAHAKTLIDGVTGGKALPPEVVEQILARTEGVPLFTEELSKTIVESGLLGDAGDHYLLDGPLPALAIPETLHDSLMARLDRHSPVKEVAQIGACIGREFDHDLLASIVPLAPEELAVALDRLVSAGLVFRRGVAPATTYIFKHALVRDAAYQSLLKTRRQELHGKIALALEQKFSHLADVQPELVAHHFDEAANAEKAVCYWLRAGQLAATRSANIEAIAHIHSGLASLLNLPPGEPRLRLELSLHLAQGGPVLATKGFASREAEAVYRRAEELSRELDDDMSLFTALRGLGYVYHVRANFREAQQLADEAVELSRRIDDSTITFDAKFNVGSLKFHSGCFEAAWESSEEGGCRPDLPHNDAYGIDLGVFSRAYRSHCEWHLGLPDRAVQTGTEALSLAREIAIPFSVAIALSYLSMLRQFRREPEEALTLAKEARALCVEHRFGYYGAWSALVRAWVIAERGALEEGLNAFDAALDEFKGTGAAARMPHYICLFAAMHRKSGRHAAGLRLIDEASHFASAHNETWCDAEIERERGELLLLSRSAGALENAEYAFMRAIDIARSQGARMLELRAAVSLATLLKRQGHRERARVVLSRVYETVTEGFETVDFREAKRLVDSLRASDEVAQQTT
jgi:class 3 adenylate cyclase/predicted ATPase